jgi:hypothetical protein
MPSGHRTSPPGDGDTKAAHCAGATRHRAVRTDDRDVPLADRALAFSHLSLVIRRRCDTDADYSVASTHCSLGIDDDYIRVTECAPWSARCELSISNNSLGFTNNSILLGHRDSCTGWSIFISSDCTALLRDRETPSGHFTLVVRNFLEATSHHRGAR